MKKALLSAILLLSACSNKLEMSELSPGPAFKPVPVVQEFLSIVPSQSLQVAIKLGTYQFVQLPTNLATLRSMGDLYAHKNADGSYLATVNADNKFVPVSHPVSTSQSNVGECQFTTADCSGSCYIKSGVAGPSVLMAGQIFGLKQAGSYQFYKVTGTESLTTGLSMQSAIINENGETQCVPVIGNPSLRVIKYDPFTPAYVAPDYSHPFTSSME